MAINIKGVILFIILAVIGIALFKNFPIEVIIMLAILYFIIIGIKMYRAETSID